MVLSSSVNGVSSRPANSALTDALTEQKYYDENCATKVTNDVLNELIEQFTNSMALLGVANLPNDPLALRKCFEVIKTQQDTNTTDIATNVTNIANAVSDISENAENIALLQEGGADGVVDVNDNPSTLVDDHIVSVDAYGTPVQRLKDDGTEWTQAGESHSVTDTSYAVVDAVGNVLFSVNSQGQLVADIASGGQYGLPFNDRTDYIGISIEGQSNAFSIAAELIDTPLTNCYVADTGLKVLDSGGLPVGDTTAIEVFEGTSADTGDTAITNVAHGVGYWLGTSNVASTNQSYFFQNSGRSGASIDEISFGTTAFTESEKKYQQMQTLLNASYKNVLFNAIVWLQGESDSIEGMTAEDYMNRLLSYIQTKSKSLIDDGSFIPFFSYQMGGHANYVNGNSYDVAIAHWKMRDIYPHYSCVAPTYMFPYVDGVHMASHGLRNLGLYFGRAINQFLSYGTFFKPVHPTKVQKKGARGILIDFHVPVAPLQFSTTTVSNLDDGHYGFEVWDGISRKTITTSTIFSDNQVYLEVSSDFTNNDVYVNYAITPDTGDAGVTLNGSSTAYTDYVAGRATGTRGCLCDSDSTVVDINDDDSAPYDMRNYCVIFREKAE